MKGQRAFGYADYYGAFTVGIFSIVLALILIASIFYGLEFKGDPFPPAAPGPKPSWPPMPTGVPPTLGGRDLPAALDATLDEASGQLITLYGTYVMVQNVTSLAPLSSYALPKMALGLASPHYAYTTDGQLMALHGAPTIPWSAVDVPAEGPPVVALGRDRMVLSLPTGDVVAYPPPPAPPFYIMTGLGPMKVLLLDSAKRTEQWYLRGHPGSMCVGTIGGNATCTDVPQSCEGATMVRYFSRQKKFVCVSEGGKVSVESL